MWVAFLAVSVGGFTLVTVGLLGLLGKLPPNHIAGIRTPYSLSSPERWYAVHQAGSPIMIFAGVAIVSAGLAFLPFVITGKISNPVAAVVLVVMATFTLAAALSSWRVGTAAARRNEGQA